MTDISRRQALVFAGAAVASAAIPAPMVAAIEAAVPPLPVWMVGTPGEFDWGAHRAATELEARIEWACEIVGTDECETGKAVNSECDCELCSQVFGAEVERKPELDAVVGEITPAHWLQVGMGHFCSRCSCETFTESGGHPVGTEAVCEDCMTLADWDIVDPERAAELRADMADEAEA